MALEPESPAPQGETEEDRRRLAREEVLVHPEDVRTITKSGGLSGKVRLSDGVQLQVDNCDDVVAGVESALRERSLMK